MTEKCKQIADDYIRQGAPADQPVLIAMLRQLQAEEGALSGALVVELAAYLSVKESLLRALIARIPSLRMADVHVLELCAGPNCGKYGTLASSAEKLCRQAGAKLRYMPCMGLCGKGPNLRFDGKLYHHADEALLRRLLGLKEEKRT